MDFVPVMAMVTLVIAIINLVKYVRAGNTNGVVTTLAVWAAGVVVVLLTAQTDFASSIVIADRSLADYNSWSLILIGLSLSTIAQFGNEIRAAIDTTDTTAKPDLL